MNQKTITFGILLSVIAIVLASYTNKIKTSAYSEELKIELSDGESLFKAKCSACHLTSKPDDMSNLIAPPMIGVMMHVKNGIEGNSENEKRKNAISFIVDYVQNPVAEKSMFGERAIKMFGVMPSQKGVVSPKELTLIANYLYDNFPKKGMKGCGDNCSSNCKH